MPLFKRKPFPLAEPPQDLKPSELVFQVRFTQEIFRDYQEYLKRLNLYRQRVWTCKVTGKTNLTYEQALVSEHRAAEKVQQIPKELMAPVLNMIQFSTLGLKELVNSIYIKLQEQFSEGMELQGKKEQSICPCKILRTSEDGEAAQYIVGWIDEDKKVTGISMLKAEDLIRKKPPLSRNVLKAFIRESTCRSTPWVIHEKLVKEHAILTEPPEELREKLSGSKGLLSCTTESTQAGRRDLVDAQTIEISKKRKRTENENSAVFNADKKKTKKEEDKEKKVHVKYPIEDLLVQPATDDPVFTDRPILSTDFSVPMDCVGDLLMVWNFCSSFGKLLNLWPFPLEYFENAICHKESNLSLIVEAHSALFRFLIKDESNYFVAIPNKKRKSKITVNNWTEYLCDFLGMVDRSELSSHMTTIKRGHYGLLDIHAKLTIFCELVAEALTTDAIRDRLEECIGQQHALVAKKREEARQKKEEQHPKKEQMDGNESNQGAILENGKEVVHDSAVESVPRHEDVPVDEGKRKDISNNGNTNSNATNSKEIMNPGMETEVSGKKGKDLFNAKGSTKGQRRGKYEDKGTLDKNPEERKEHLEREIEKLSIRINTLGKDRNYNRYWFFRREGRLFFESSDSKQWGYYSTKEELDAFMGSLNPKGERERALQLQLEKHYLRISTALQKRSKEIALKILQEEAALRRSTRVRSQPRDDLSMAFTRYVNKWKEN